MLILVLSTLAFASDSPAWERHEVVIGATVEPRPIGPPGTLDVELVDADLPAVFRFLADSGGVNFVMDGAITGTVTLHLRAVTWDDALAAVLAVKGLWLSPVGTNTWVVTTTPPGATPPSRR